MSEMTFCTSVVKSFKAIGLWSYKIPDMPTSSAHGLRFNPAKPFDIIAVNRNKSFCVEAKYFKKFQAFGIRHMRESQLKALDEIEDFGGNAYVFLNVQFNGSKNLGVIRTNRLYYWRWKDFKSQCAAESGSIKKKTLLNCKNYIDKFGGLFNLSVLV